MSQTVCQSCQKTYQNENDYLKFGKNFKICSKGHLWFSCECNSSCVVPKEDSSWYKPEDNMSKEAKEIFLQIKESGTIPYIPNEIAKLLALMTNDGVTSKRIEAELKLIPLLAVNVLDMANNVKITTDYKISKLEHAISYLGMHTLSNIVMSASFKSFTFRTKHFDHDKFWDESRIAGIISEYLVSQLAPHLESDEAYLAASLCNIGKVVGAITLSTQIDDIYQMTKNPKDPISWLQAEKRLNAIPHTVLGEIAGVLWGLPDYVMNSIKYHHLLASEVPELPHAPSKIITNSSHVKNLQGISLRKDGQTLGIHDIAALANQYSHWVLLEPHLVDQFVLGSYGQRAGLDSQKTEITGSDIVQFIRHHKIIN